MDTPLSPENDIGYQFYPPTSEYSPGCPRLDIHLFDVPTHHHFDPKTADVKVVEHNKIKSLTIHHPWIDKQKYTVCASIVTVKDRNGKKFEAFTFGADLEISRNEMVTDCVLVSAAPIIELPQNVLEPSSFSVMLVEEVEILFADIKARFLPTESAYEKMIIKTPADVLYLACLKELKEKFQDHHYSEHLHMLEFKQSLDSEIQSLKNSDAWPLYIHPLDKLIHE